MTTAIDSEEIVSEEVEKAQADYALYERTREAFNRTPEEFAALAAKERDVALFLMIRYTNANAEFLANRISEWEAKLQPLTTPEGRQAAIGEFMASFGMGGGMLKGLMG